MSWVWSVLGPKCLYTGVHPLLQEWHGSVMTIGDAR